MLIHGSAIRLKGVEYGIVHRSVEKNYFIFYRFTPQAIQCTKGMNFQQFSFNTFDRRTYQ
jgi:hypothetical protein